MMGKDVYPLLPQQKAIYAACSKNTNILTYNMPARILLPEDIDLEKLKQSIQKTIDHHKILNSYIKLDGEKMVGVYADATEFQFEEWEEGMEESFVRPFDLSRAPLVRVGFTNKEMLFDMHHIVADGESLNIILKDIAAVYQGGKLSEQTISYGDYAEYFYHQDMAGHKAFFKNMLLCDFEPVTLPATKKPERGGKSEIYTIPQTFVSAARNYARKHNLTDTMVFLGAYGILLSKYSAKTEILSSIILQNRIYKDTKNMAGMFVNTLPFHLKIKDALSEYMENVRRLMLDLYEYQEFPFPLIAEHVGMNDKSVINTCFVYQADGEKYLTIEGKQLAPVLWDTHEAKFDLMMELVPVGGQIKLRMEYNGTKYDKSLMDRLFDAYTRILTQLEKESIADIRVMSDEEYQMVVEKFNDTCVEYPKEKCVHELFTEQVRKTPDRVALVFEDRRFTYKELDEMSNSLAHYLREKGVRPNDVVPIVVKRSWHVIVAMLGVLKAGGAYMPVDPNYPVERMEYMMTLAGSKTALVYGYDKEMLVERVDLRTFDYENNRSSVANINHATDSAYIIFTSGSTGMPKGITINHYNVGNYVHNNNNNVCHKIIKNKYETIVSVTNIVFDIFVTESLLPLLNGLCIYMADDDEVVSQKKLSTLFEKNSIDIIQTTPTKMKGYMLDKDNVSYLKNVKAIVMGGEAFPQDLYYELKRCTTAHIFNIYGPAETTVWSTNAELISADITIGKPIANTQIYILDKNNQPLPIGVAGELCIAGAGVGKGYLNRPELTAEKFVPNPFATEQNRHGATMYHTGDLARWRADGEIEYLGRIDTQVKIRGLRIELGEIESIMSSFRGIRLTAVADKRDETGRQYLVGYYTTADGDEVDEKELRHHLSAKLPKYMIPNYFMHLDQMPMTPSGKTDRKNLPVPEFSVETDNYVAPETEQERKLCHLLEELLHMEKIGVEDDFFAYGGDSLGAIEYVAQAHNIGIEIGLQNVFDYPTVRDLCNFLNGGKSETIQYRQSDFEKYARIFEHNVIDTGLIPQKKALGNVFLTGATGFLGAHVLDQLIGAGTEKIYCLVRSNKPDDRRGRLKETLQYYFDDKYADEIGKHIIPIIGNIEQEGLSEQLPSDVQTVIHTAASVKHYGSYSYFHKVNVEGTQHVIDYAKAIGAKLIHVSTLSVSGNSLADDFSVYRSEEEKHFYETSLYIGQPLDNVYIHSKFEAEKRVYDAMLDGLDAKVVRVGNLTNRAWDYRFQPNYKENAFLTRVKAILEFGLFPDYLMDLYAEFSPVDKTAEGIVKIAQYADQQTVFHLNSNRVIYFNRFLDVVHELGIAMKVADEKTFNHALQKTVKEHGTEYILRHFRMIWMRAGVWYMTATFILKMNLHCGS
jgi:amino acid adenylation domain-containing protein/thioester reductase-like protein